MGGDRALVGRLRSRLLAAAATLNQQGDEKYDMGGEHDEKNITKAFAPVVLNLDGANGSPRNLEWIEFFHSFA